MKYEIMDGNKACATMSYLFTEVAAIYPITPASTMAENIDVFSTNNKKNFFNDTVKVVEMQSEAGAIATVHGLLQNGILATTYTASQGLLLMIPNMYKIAGELLPCVINVASRTIATHALSIMGDHSDIYAVRQTGFAILSSTNVQQAMDLTAVSHLSTIKGKIPFVHFFDGFRTSHEYQKITLPDFDKIKKLIDMKSLNEFRENSLNIDNPTTRGTNEQDQIYFQNVEARNKYYDALPDIVNDYMEKLNKINNTNYKPFNYYGSPKAKRLIVAMGSICDTIKEYLSIANDKDLGLIEVHLYRPFSKKYFLNVLPKTTKKIAILDRTKEPGAKEPLYLDVTEIIKSENLKIDTVSGRYGLSSKDTNLNDIEATYNYLKEKNNHVFTLGITDDVTNLSLKRTNTKFNLKQDEILIYGYASDGMVTASKDILRLIGTLKDKYIQGYFEYDSKKSGGVTKCHLRFSNKEIRSRYYVTNPKLVVCTKDTYLKKYNLLENIDNNATFILNTSYNQNDLSQILPQEFIKTLKSKNITFYIIDATKIAKENNIPNKISMIMEMCLLKVANLIDYDKAFNFVCDMIRKNFESKGQDVIDSNINAIKSIKEALHQIDINSLSSTLKQDPIENTVFSYLEHLKGNDLPVSAFTKYASGTFEGGLSSLEKRQIATAIPSYDASKCSSCSLCSFICPHAVIRPFILTEKELKKAPASLKEKVKKMNIDGEDLYFTIGISSYDCTGCSLCSNICPTKAITMQSILKSKTLQEEYNYLDSLKPKQIYPKNTIKGSQLIKPKFMFNGACAGCGETPYLKLLTQLFTDSLMIANATGCSSIYSSSLPSTPYQVPWANSLFEDNAEFGYGFRLAEDYMQNRIRNILEENITKQKGKNKKLIEQYLQDDTKQTKEKFYQEFDFTKLEELIPLKKYLKQKSIWLVGGDGWAYDIGFGGIDHILSTNENVNILVLDTEVYSNTGGQSSKSTRLGAVAKFASSGKKTAKKDLSIISLTYPNIYVATICLGANYQQTINAFLEADNHQGPSIIIAYAPCIAHGIKQGMSSMLNESRLACQSGYFPLFRYNPETKEFKMDSKADFTKYEELLNNENRYRINSELLQGNKLNAMNRYDKLTSFQDKTK